MHTNQVARTAALLGEPARTAMLLALMDGRALTAAELAKAGLVTPATASRHLALLQEAGLLAMEKQGRHRYHRLASPEVAALIENLMQLSTPPAAAPTGPRDAALRRARVCYDHLAGRLGMAIADHLVASDAIVLQPDAQIVSMERLSALLQGLGLVDGAIQLAQVSSRPACRACLDWSERRSHVAGRLGVLICAHVLERGWLLRSASSRALTISTAGAHALRDWMGTARWHAVTGD